MTMMPRLVVLVVGQLVLVLLVQSRSMPLSYVMLGHRKVDRVTKRIGWMLLYRTHSLSLSLMIYLISKPTTHNNSGGLQLDHEYSRKLCCLCCLLLLVITLEHEFELEATATWRVCSGRSPDRRPTHAARRRVCSIADEQRCRCPLGANPQRTGWCGPRRRSSRPSGGVDGTRRWAHSSRATTPCSRAIIEPIACVSDDVPMRRRSRHW